jgi:hypothetical protein
MTNPQIVFAVTKSEAFEKTIWGKGQESSNPYHTILRAARREK